MQENKKIYKILTGIFCLIFFTCIMFLPEPQEKIQNNFEYKKCIPDNVEDYEKNQDLLKYSFSHNTILYYHYLNNGRYKDAIKTIDKFEKDDFYPTCYRYQSNRVRFICKTKMRIFNHFFGSFINAEEQKHIYKANAYYKSGDIENAKKELNLQKESFTLSDKIKFRIYLDEENFEEAEKLIENKNSYDKKIYTAELYSAKKDYLKAEKLYNEIIKDLPKRDDIKISYASMLMKQKQYSTAIKILKSAKEDKYFYAINYNLGACYKNIGNNKQAKEYFKKVLSKKPDNKEFIEYLTTGILQPVD